MSIKIVTHYTEKNGEETYLAYDPEAPGDIFRATGGAHGWVHAQNHEMWQVLNELASKKEVACSECSYDREDENPFKEAEIVLCHGL